MGLLHCKIITHKILLEGSIINQQHESKERENDHKTPLIMPYVLEGKVYESSSRIHLNLIHIIIN
jgi:hypothetical protein